MINRSTFAIIALLLALPACAPAPSTLTATLPNAQAAAGVIPVSAVQGATIKVRLRLPIRVQAAGKTAADIDRFRVRLVDSHTDTTVAEGEVTTSEPQFSLVPDGTYHLMVDALDVNGTSIVEGGEQQSLNSVTVQSPSVIYSDGSDSLIVVLNLLGATGENLAGTILINEGPYHAGVVQLGCTYPTDGTYLGVSLTEGSIYTVAGNGSVGLGGDGGPAAGATLFHPQGVAVDPAGNALVADSGSGRVRLAAAAHCANFGLSMTPAYLYTVAGGGEYTWDGEKGTAVQLGSPRHLAVDSLGNILFADASQNRVYMLAKKAGTYFGIEMEANTVWTVAGGGAAGDGGTAFVAALNQPNGVALDGDGNLYIAEAGSHRIRFVPRQDGTYFGQAMLANRIYTIAGTGQAGPAADGLAAVQSPLNSPAGVSVDGAGNVYIADTQNHRVHVVPKQAMTYGGRSLQANNLYTIAGTGTAGYSGDFGEAHAASLNGPTAVAADAAGNLAIADTQNNRVRYVPVSNGNAFLMGMDAFRIYTIAGSDTIGYNGDGGPAVSAWLAAPSGVAIDAQGNVFVADTGNQRVRLIAKSGYQPPIVY